MIGPKSTSLPLALVLFLAPAFMPDAVAAAIRNRLDQRLLIRLTGGRTLDLPAQGTAQVTSQDLSSPALQNLVGRGSVVVVSDSPPEPSAAPTAAAPPFEGVWRFTATRDARLATEELQLERGEDGTLTGQASAGLGKVTAVQVDGRHLKISCRPPQGPTRLLLTLSADGTTLRGRMDPTDGRAPGRSSPCSLERVPDRDGEAP